MIVFKTENKDFPGGLAAKTLLPAQGAQVRALVRELESCMLQLKDPMCRN